MTDIVVVMESSPDPVDAVQGEIIVVAAGDAGPQGATGAQGTPGISGDHDGLLNTDNPEAHPQYKPIESGFRATIPQASVYSFDEGTRTFTIQPVGASFSFFSNELQFTKTVAENFVISDVDGPHYIYYDATGTLQEFTALTTLTKLLLFREHCIVVALYWNVTQQQAVMIGDERHGRTMDSTTHAWLHATTGAAHNSGLGVSNLTPDGTGNSDAHAQGAVTDGSYFDEDYLHFIADGAPQDISPIGQFPFMARIGTAGVFQRFAANGLLTRATGTGRAAWNEFTGLTWQISEIPDGQYFVVNLVALTDLTHQIILTTPQAYYATLDEAEEEARTPFDVSDLGDIDFISLDWLRLGAIVMQTSDAYINSVKSRVVSVTEGDYVDWRRSVNPAANQAGISDHNQLTNRTNATAHTQYQLLAAKGLAGGYAELDGSGFVPDAQLAPAIARDVEITAAIAAHVAALDPHPVYLTAAEGGALFDPLGAAVAAVVAHEAAGDPHPQYTTAAEVAVAIGVHAAAADPHTGYQLESEKGAANGYASLDGTGTVPDAQIPAVIARDAEVTAAVAAHAAAVDPHTGYQKESEKGVANGYASLDGTGVVPDAQIPAAIARDAEVTAAIAAHAALPDPHTVYQLESEKGVANGYAALDGTGTVPDAQIPAAIARDAEVTAAIAAHVALTDPHAQYFQGNSNVSDFFSDFYSATSGSGITFHNSGAGSGNSVPAGTTASRPGVVESTTGTSTNGSAGWNSGLILFGGGAWVLEAGVVTPATLSGAVDYSMRVGFFDVFPGAAVDGAYFRHVNGQANWRCITRSNSVETDTDSGVAVVVSTYVRFRIEVNAAASSVGFYINDTLVATVATNIPSGAGRDTSFGAHVQKNATGTGGGTDRIMTTDFVRVRSVMTAVRS